MKTVYVTERGDAGLDLSWYDKVKPNDCVILITKRIHDEFIKKVISAMERGVKIVVHATCTGLGKTDIEPNVPEYTTQLQKLKQLIARGFLLKIACCELTLLFRLMDVALIKLLWKLFG